MYSRLRINLLQLKYRDFIKSTHLAYNINSTSELKTAVNVLREGMYERIAITKEISNRLDVLNCDKKLEIKIYCTQEKNIEVEFLLHSEVGSPYLKECLPVYYYQNSINHVSETIVRNKKSECNYSIVFQLPSSPHLVLSWLNYMDFYFSVIKAFKINDVSISCGHQNNPANFNEFFKSIFTDIANVFNMSGNVTSSVNQDNQDSNHFLFQLVNGILSLDGQCHKSYQDAIDVLMTLNEKLRAGNYHLPSLLLEYQLYGHTLSSSDETNCLSRDRARLILSFCKISRDLIASGKKNDLNAYFNQIDFHAKNRLYGLCLNKIAPSGKNYHYNDTQWYFLDFSEFRLINKKICIDNILNNGVYKDFYADNCVSYQDYEQDIQSLLSDLDLDVEPNSDLRSCIVFTDESTKKLMSLGFCLKDECQRVIYMQNSWKLFSVASEGNRIAPYYCPEEVANKIFDLNYAAKP